MAGVRLPKVKCKRCGWEWVPRVANPKWCPKCNSPYWNRERQRESMPRAKSRNPDQIEVPDGPR